ncbi:DUF3848 domain-containing protein [Oscillospiraceae bacterium DSM 107454]|uniref:DUF3848 domain-containing protein n=2 Tax=Ructibacterium gallinarum TaxID=2779355 RepID=A0A9D5M5Y7_9FIRM|nr:DUF3848 domain-containing protein [Ructibacterium gallinarum]
MNSNNLRELLLEKVYKEQSDFIETLKLQPPEKIIDSSYEKVMRDDILMTFEDDYLSDEQVMELLKLDYPLSACYNEWMDTDYSHMEMLRDTIDDYTKRLVDENKQESEKTQKKKYEPER